MKLSTKGQYGVRAMYDLAQLYGGAPQSVKCIAERQGIPEAYLEQLIAPLRKAGLVLSIRGAQGGYILAKEPAAISVGAILRALEGPLAATECVVSECERANGCAMHALWLRIHRGVNEVMDSISCRTCSRTRPAAARKRNRKQRKFKSGRKEPRWREFTWTMRRRPACGRRWPRRFCPR